TPSPEPDRANRGASPRGAESKAQPAGKAPSGTARKNAAEPPKAGDAGDPTAAQAKNEAGSPEGTAQKAAPDGKPTEKARESLAEAKANQKAIAEQFQKMLDEMSQFETYRGVVKDAQELA